MPNQLSILEKAPTKTNVNFVYDNMATDVLMSNLGTFWSQIIDDQLVRAKLSGQVLLDEQTILDSAAAIAAVSMFELPVFNKKLWKLFSFSESNLLANSKQPYKLGDTDIELGGETPIVLGQTRDIADWRIKLPANVVTVGYITDNVFKPTTIWAVDTHFTIEDGYIVFKQNPFDASFRLTKTDTENICNMWLCNIRQDLNDIYNEFGYVLDLYTRASSDNYLTLVQAGFNSLINGTNSLALRSYMASVLGIKIVENDIETVEVVQTTAKHLQIITNKSVYEFAKTATSLVSVGDRVYRGDILVDTVKIYDSVSLRSDSLPFSFLTIAPHLMNKKLNGALIFKNKAVSTVYTLDSDGYADVRFDIGGEAEDVQTFWTNAKAAWEASGVSVAASLRKTPGTNMPVESDVMPTVNPMNYLIKNIFNYNCIIVSIKIESGWVNAQNYLLPLIPYIRNIVPPSTALFLITEFNQGTESHESMTDNPGSPVMLSDITSTDQLGTINETCEVFRV